jgi:hypothetical protein
MPEPAYSEALSLLKGFGKYRRFEQKEGKQGKKP